MTARAWASISALMLFAGCASSPSSAPGVQRGVSALRYLESNGVGPAHFGLSERAVIAALRPSLGRPNASGINTGCGKDLTEVAWHDLIAEFRHGRFSGYRFIHGGWPLTTPGSPHDRVAAAAPVPALSTAAGITLGSTFGELRSAYGPLMRTASFRWTAPNGLTFTGPSTAADATSAGDKIVEIQTRTCGDF
ncbi:MAG TPA: hypothetical protein VEH55_06865 [Gaiellaceae bacterium]|nr:hypothetical protein [Gaiellaceae bacterium]